MPKPLVGVIGSGFLVNGRYAAQLVGEKNLRAVAEVADALPLMFGGASDLTDIGPLLDTVDGILLTGARANVHPIHFNAEPHPSHEPYDRGRDEVALQVAKACIARGVPILGLCRGIQEMGVAFGSTLHPEIRDLPGRMNHRATSAGERGDPHPDQEVVFADRHEVRLVPGGVFARLFGRRDGPRQLAPRSGHPGAGRPRRRRGGGGRRHHRGHPYRRRVRASRWESSGMPSTIRKPIR